MGDYGNSSRPNPLAHAQRRASSRLLHNRCFFLSVRELQFPRALPAPPPDVALPLTLMPRPPASPSPSLSLCVSDPKAVRGGGTVGGAAAFSSSQHQQHHQQQQRRRRQRQQQQQRRPCGATGSACSQGISPQSGPEPLSPRSSAPGSAFHSASRVSAAGGKAAGSSAACVQPVLAPPRAPGVRSAGRAGVLATSIRPVSGAGGERGRQGRRRGTSSEPLPVASRAPAARRPPAGRRRGAEFAAPHPARWEEAPL